MCGTCLGEAEFTIVARLLSATSTMSEGEANVPHSGCIGVSIGARILRLCVVEPWTAKSDAGRYAHDEAIQNWVCLHCSLGCCFCAPRRTRLSPLCHCLYLITYNRRNVVFGWLAVSLCLCGVSSPRLPGLCRGSHKGHVSSYPETARYHERGLLGKKEWRNRQRRCRDLRKGTTVLAPLAAAARRARWTV